MSTMRVILHRSDFSRAFAAAFAKAAKANRAELLLVHMVSPVVPMVGDGHVPPRVYQDLEASSPAYGTEGE